MAPEQKGTLVLVSFKDKLVTLEVFDHRTSRAPDANLIEDKELVFDLSLKAVQYFASRSEVFEGFVWPLTIITNPLTNEMIYVLGLTPGEVDALQGAESFSRVFSEKKSFVHMRIGTELVEDGSQPSVRLALGLAFMDRIESEDILNILREEVLKGTVRSFQDFILFIANGVLDFFPPVYIDQAIKDGQALLESGYPHDLEEWCNIYIDRLRGYHNRPVATD